MKNEYTRKMKHEIMFYHIYKITHMFKIFLSRFGRLIPNKIMDQSLHFPSVHNIQFSNGKSFRCYGRTLNLQRNIHFGNISRAILPISAGHKSRDRFPSGSNKSSTRNPDILLHKNLQLIRPRYDKIYIVLTGGLYDKNKLPHIPDDNWTNENRQNLYGAQVIKYEDLCGSPETDKSVGYEDFINGLFNDSEFIKNYDIDVARAEKNGHTAIRNFLIDEAYLIYQIRNQIGLSDIIYPIFRLGIYPYISRSLGMGIIEPKIKNNGQTELCRRH